MRYLFIQVKESLNFADTWLPSNINGADDCEYLFQLLKDSTTFINDPPQTELLQTMQTLFKNNFWNVSGAGDCDCFVITVTACCIVAGIETRIVLAGRQKGNAVHIYNEVKDDSGKWQPFDLTQDFYKEKRFYPYLQKIPIK